MIRAALVLGGALALAACKKHEGASAAASASASAPAAAPADSGAPVAASAPERPIDDCCAALAVATDGHGKRAKTRALDICPQLAAMVRSGRAPRQQALTQVRAGLEGQPAPAPCR